MRSTGGTAIMDCNLSRLLLALGPADRGADDRAALDRHVAGCPACAALAGRAAGFDAAIGAAMRDVPVPATLHDDLLKSAYAARGAAWRRTAYRYAALAAGLLLAVGVTFGGVWRFRPKLDGYALVSATEQEREFRKTVVGDWLAKQDLPDELPFPVDFDLALHAFHGKGELRGRDVPVILFQRGTDQARVFVVREGQLNTAELVPEDGSLWKLAVVRHPTVKGVTYVVLHTNSFEIFRRQPLGPPT